MVLLGCVFCKSPPYQGDIPTQIPFLSLHKSLFRQINPERELSPEPSRDRAEGSKCGKVKGDFLCLKEAWTCNLLQLGVKSKDPDKGDKLETFKGQQQFLETGKWLQQL